jgi:hypothetical protein
MHSWPLVAAVYNLEVDAGMRTGPHITATQARRTCMRAMRVLRRELARRGVTEAEFDAYLAMRDAADARVHDNLNALLPAVTATRDEADPDARRSLRKVV